MPHHVGVSIHGGTPKSSVFYGMSLTNHPAIGAPSWLWKPWCYLNTLLVGGFNPETYDFVSWDDEIPNDSQDTDKSETKIQPTNPHVLNHGRKPKNTGIKHPSTDINRRISSIHSQWTPRLPCFGTAQRQEKPPPSCRSGPPSWRPAASHWDSPRGLFAGEFKINPGISVSISQHSIVCGSDMSEFYGLCLVWIGQNSMFFVVVIREFYGLWV